ncbi:MAG: hypothetical protein ACRDV9_13450 [Acidimicrobiia bacterium]
MQDEVDRLAELSPEEFVAARDELAKRLKGDGQAARAAEVKRLRRPTVSQWITDQVLRHHRDVVEALRETSSEVATAQEAAIIRGDREALRNATTKRREALRALGQAVDQVLVGHGRPAHHRDEVTSAIESGVTAEIASGTFGLPDDLELPQRPPTEPMGAPPEDESSKDEIPENEIPEDDPAEDLEKRRLAAQRAAEAKAAIESAEARVKRARQELERAEAELEAAMERHGQAGSDV